MSRSWLWSSSDNAAASVHLPAAASSDDAYVPTPPLRCTCSWTCHKPRKPQLPIPSATCPTHRRT